jgi:hypothetical protein
MYEKSIILTRDKRMENFIKNLLRSRKKSFETSIPLLTDMDAIKEDIHKVGTTVNVRGEFAYFIKNYGFPYMFLMDYQVDFSLPLQNDPDKRKLLRTFLLAYVLLAYGKGFENAVANIVFIVDKSNFSTVTQFVKNPAVLLEQIHTKDDRINAIIDSYAQNKDRAREFFRLSYIFRPEGGKYAAEMDRLEKIMEIFDQNIASFEEEETRPVRKEPVTEMIPDDLKPADVICRATLAKIIVNGESRDIREEEKNSYVEKNIHISGAVTQRTLPEVKNRIFSTFNVMAKLNPFKKDERIFIKLPDASTVDGAFAISMGSFLVKELGEYGGISIDIGKDNLEKLKKSEGYFAIEEFIIKNL